MFLPPGQCNSPESFKNNHTQHFEVPLGNSRQCQRAYRPYVTQKNALNNKSIIIFLNSNPRVLFPNDF